MKPIAVFYHCLFFHGQPPKFEANALEIVRSQMQHAQGSGLFDAADQIVIGVNGGEESRPYASIFPEKARVVFHGLDSHSENLTLVEIENWLPNHPGWAVIYFHSKGATRPEDDGMRKRWRNCMMGRCVGDWRGCVRLLEGGYDSVGCHWMSWRTWPNMPPGQSIWAGNFWWATSDFLRTLPSIKNTARVKLSGIASSESRFEAEVWIGNGPRLPRVKELAPRHRFMQCP